MGLWQMNMMMEIGIVTGVVMEEEGVEGGVVVTSVAVEEEDTMDRNFIYSKMEDTTKTFHFKAEVIFYFASSVWFLIDFYLVFSCYMLILEVESPSSLLD